MKTATTTKIATEATEATEATMATTATPTATAAPATATAMAQRMAEAPTTVRLILTYLVVPHSPSKLPFLCLSILALTPTFTRLLRDTKS